MQAWVVYSFVFLLIAFLGGPDKHMQVRLSFEFSVALFALCSSQSPFPLT